MKKFFFRLCTSERKGLCTASNNTAQYFKTLSMSKQFQFLVVFFLSMLILQCTKKLGEDSSYVPVNITCTLTKNVDSARILIQGKWNWVQEERAIQRGGYIAYFTPHTEGHTEGLKFNKDTVFFIKNDVILDTSKFDFRPYSEFSNYPPDPNLIVIVYYNIHSGNSNSGGTPFKICKDYFILQFQFFDDNRGDFTYKKIN